ncbi:phiSA1p31-related protein [Streptomyces albidoflavus]|uniref:phiSA1p31-related protein n=1 Tax=Streptomyces albidoflavus TaxID=1886 RepID=UPI0033E08557
MADATKQTVTRTVTEETFTLTLSADEFQYLKSLVGRQTIQAGDGANGRIYEAMTEDLIVNEVTPEPATYTHNGVTYDLTSEYRDGDGDYWHFTGGRTEDGVPLMSCRFVATFGSTEDSEYQDWTLPRVLASYTLTRV